jgi:hypothetical protein
MPDPCEQSGCLECIGWIFILVVVVYLIAK